MFIPLLLEHKKLTNKKLKEDDPALPHGYVFTIAMDRPVEI